MLLSTIGILSHKKSHKISYIKETACELGTLSQSRSHGYSVTLSPHESIT